MTQCVLDDLVPKAKINKVTLESVLSDSDSLQAVSSGRYNLTCDVSIYDTVSTKDDIAQLFFTDDFRKYFNINIVLARDELALEAIDIIRGLDLEDYEISKLCILLFCRSYPPYQYYMNVEYIPDLSAISRLETLFSQMSEESYSFRVHNFASPLGSQVDYGFNTFDDDGNYIYELKLPIEERQVFTNSFDVEQCKLFAIPSYNFQQAFLDRGFDGVERSAYDSFSYESIEEMTVLENKRIVDSRVEDFRLIERASEFIAPTTVVGYEKDIEAIKYLRGNIGKDTKYSDVFSPLFSSFSLESGLMTTTGFFFFDIERILMRNSDRAFLYANSDIDFTSEHVLDVRVRKERVEDKNYISYIESITEKSTPYQSILSYQFDDQDTQEVGKYAYTAELTLLDPMQSIVESHVVETVGKRYSILKVLKECLEYLNNSKEYNSLTEEITSSGRREIENKLRNDGVEQSLMMFHDLYFLFTGNRFYDVCQGYRELREIYESPSPKAKISNLIRAIEDFIFEVSKYFDLESLNGTANRTSPSSIIEVNYRFPQLVDCEIMDRGLFAANGIRKGISKAEYTSRMEQELQKFSSLNTDNARNLGYITPDTFRDIDLLDLKNSEDAFFSFVTTSFVGSESTNLQIDKALLDPEINTAPDYSIKNDSATFEEFASTLGLSVIPIGRLQIESEDSQEDFRLVRGIEYGKNSITANNGDFLDTGIRRESRISTSSQNRKTALLTRRSKKEELITRFLNATDGYSLLDRESFVQGEYQNSRHDNSRSLQVALQDSVPTFLSIHPNFYYKSGSEDVFTSLFYRMFINNIFVVQYLRSVKDQSGSMTMQWEDVRDLDNVPSGVLCRLERYRSDVNGIKDSYLVDREIMSKYFYLS